MPNKIEQTKKGLIEAMQKTLGNVTQSCKVVGIARSTFYEYYNSDKEFAKSCDDCENIALDFVESQLHKQIKEGTASSTIFYLKTKGRKRGYIERKEVIDNQVESSEFNYDAMPIELLKKLNEFRKS